MNEVRNSRLCGEFPVETNIVRLPTAAKRKVANPGGLELAHAIRNLPQHPAKWEDHGGQKAWQDAHFTRSPEMLIITAILKLLPDAAKEEVRRKIATMADMATYHHAPTALAIVEGLK